jgi:hypothetical protein
MTKKIYDTLDRAFQHRSHPTPSHYPMQKSVVERLFALRNPDSDEYKEMVKCLMEKILNQKFIEECIGAFMMTIIREEDNKKITPCPINYENKISQVKSMGLFS